MCKTNCERETLHEARQGSRIVSYIQGAKNRPSRIRLGLLRADSAARVTGLVRVEPESGSTRSRVGHSKTRPSWLSRLRVEPDSGSTRTRPVTRATKSARSRTSRLETGRVGYDSVDSSFPERLRISQSQKLLLSWNHCKKRFSPGLQKLKRFLMRSL